MVDRLPPPDPVPLAPFVRNGYLFLYEDAKAMEAARGRVAMQRDEGVSDVASALRLLSLVGERDR